MWKTQLALNSIKGAARWVFLSSRAVALEAGLSPRDKAVFGPIIVRRGQGGFAWQPYVRRLMEGEREQQTALTVGRVLTSL